MNAKDLIDHQISDLTDWRGPALNQLRALINAADSQLEEQWKWNTAVWASNGLVCAISSFKEHVKLNIFQGANIPDPFHLFNAGLGAKNSRSIDFSENDNMDAAKITQLIQAAASYNRPKV